MNKSFQTCEELLKSERRVKLRDLLHEEHAWTFEGDEDVEVRLPVNGTVTIQDSVLGEEDKRGPLIRCKSSDPVAFYVPADCVTRHKTPKKQKSQWSILVHSRPESSILATAKRGCVREEDYSSLLLKACTQGEVRQRTDSSGKPCTHKKQLFALRPE